MADNSNPHSNTKPMLVVEPMHHIGVILLPVVKVMCVEHSGASETGFVGEENILQKMFFFLFLSQVPTYKLFTREVVGRE